MSEPRHQQTSRPAVTAIIATYNRGRFLGAAIESVLNQTYPPAQVIIVDDGSVDSTARVLEGFRGRVLTIRKANGGKASALNLGLESAIGELIWVFDDDDLALPDSLEKLVSALTEHPDCGFAYGAYDHLVEDVEGRPELITPRLPFSRSLDLRQSILERCYIFQPGLLVRRSCYDAVGRFNESMVRSQDYEMLLRISRQFDGIDVNCILFHQRQHSGVRGTAGSPVAAGKKDAAWMKYDRLIFSKIYDKYSLCEYLPGRMAADMELSPLQQRAAMLERCCILVRKGMWSVAASDLRSVAALLQTQPSRQLTASELATLKRFVGPYSYADPTLSESGVFFVSLSELTPASLRWRVAFLLQSPWLIEIAFCIRRFHVRYFLGTARKCLNFWFMFMRHSRGAQSSMGSVAGTEPR